MGKLLTASGEACCSTSYEVLFSIDCLATMAQDDQDLRAESLKGLHVARKPREVVASHATLRTVVLHGTLVRR